MTAQRRSLRAVRCCCATALWTIFASGLALAEPPAPVGIESVPLDNVLDLPIQAVSLRQERTEEAAAATFVLTAEDLRLQGFRTLGEALSSVPGLFVFRDDLFAMVGVRGLGLASDYGTRLLLLVDGHAITDSVGLGGTLVDRDFPIPIDVVKRIEVVKGPVGSVYGPTAFLGVINVITYDPDDRATQLRAGGEAGQQRLSGGEGGLVVTGSSGALRFTGAAQAHGSRGSDYRLPELLVPIATREPATTPWVRDANRSSSQSGFARLEWRGVVLSGACGRSEKGLVTGAYLSKIGDKRTRLDTRNCFVDVSYGRPITEKLAIDLRTSYDDAHYADVFAYDPPPADYGLVRDISHDQWISADTRLTWRPLPGTLAIGGVTARFHSTRQRVASDDLPTAAEDPVDGVYPGDIRKDYTNLNGYALLDQRILSTLRMTLGLAWHWHEILGQRLTPKVAAIWSPTANDSLKLLYSRGFRAPTASEVFYEDGIAYLANRQLRPETVDAFEAIYERRLGKRASFTASLFANRYTDLIRYETVSAPGITDPDPNDPTHYRLQARNSGALWLRGGEISASARFGRWIQGWGGASLQGLGGGTHMNFPTLTWNVSISTRALLERLALAVNVSGLSRRAKDPDNAFSGTGSSVSSAAIVNLAATLDSEWVRGLSIELAIRNLLDAAAPDPLLADYAPVSELPQPARVVRFSLRYRFD